MTLSITARCSRTGALGIAIASSSPAVAARCAHVRAGIGAVATQNVTDPRLGPRALDLMQLGQDARSALATLVAETPNISWRQLALVDAQGEVAAYTGARALGRHGAVLGAGCVAAGNLLADTAVLGAVASAFVASPDDELGDRLLAALGAGAAAGGEAGPLHSAGMQIARGLPWPETDLRVDWDEGAPLTALLALWLRWKPQAQDYVLRALNPDAAPGFGVPGNP
jgi:uncharacterized Ntn-hydrolase superfamily protein